MCNRVVQGAVRVAAGLVGRLVAQAAAGLVVVVVAAAVRLARLRCPELDRTSVPHRPETVPAVCHKAVEAPAEPGASIDPAAHDLERIVVPV
jgi:hypothetical protein